MIVSRLFLAILLVSGQVSSAAEPSSRTGENVRNDTADRIRAHVEWLAAPEREGRATGSGGARASANYLVDRFKELGLEPVGKDYLQAFDFEAGVRLLPGHNHFQLVAAGKAGKGGEQALEKDFRPLAFSGNGKVQGEVVYVGYGLSVPEGNGGRYNSYDGLDVQDKIVLMFRYVPEGVSAERRAQLNRYAGLRYKAMLARERGAKAVLFVSGPNSAGAGELIGLNGDGSLSGSGIVAMSISQELATRLVVGTGKSLRQLQDALDKENPHAETAVGKGGVQVSLEAGVEHVRQQDHNVLAVLPPAPGQEPAEYVVVGAHYDHLGFGKGSSSLARAGEESRVHPGADDNASGVAAVLQVAADLAKQRAGDPGRFRRGIIFACWSGEEIGLIGSNAFSQNPPVDVKSLVAYFNFDMVGRLREDKLTVQGVGSSKAWRPMVEKANAQAGFKLVLQDDPYLPTDTTSLYPKGIPVLNFFTGAHEDYHRPTDTAEKLDYPGIARIARFAGKLVAEVVSGLERPGLARVVRSEQGGGDRETLRAYLGTIPDYSTEAEGVKIAGVRGGSPAEKAGLQGGDVIVELGKQKIANIYDYTYALDAVKIGEKVVITVDRGGKRVVLEIVPARRP